MFGMMPYQRRGLRRSPSSVDSLSSFVDSFFRDGFSPLRSLSYDTFKVDIKENDDTYIIEAELPGIKKEEVKLDYKEGRLSICVTRDESKEEEQEGYIHRERSYASSSRSVFLKDIDEESIKAKLQDGILVVEARRKVLDNSGKEIVIE